MSNPFFSKISFVNKISSVMKATSDDESPISGFLLQEISNITFESAETCESCLEFLVDRLDSESTHVKLKVLKLMKFIVENGHENFRFGLLKKSRGIKEATKFSGPLHPLHGNTPYIMVRKAAKALTELLFSTENVSQTSSAITVQKTQIHAVGIGPGQMLHSGSNSRMEGFGNTGYQSQSKTVGDSIKDGLLKMAEKLDDSTSQHQRELLTTLESTSNYTPPTDTSGKYSSYTATMASQYIPTKHVKTPQHIPGRAGGGWEDSDDDGDEVGDDESHSEFRSVGSNNTELEDRLGEIVQETDFSTEKSVVSSYINNDDGCLLLPRSQLKSFLKECGGLNCDKVVEVIRNDLSKMPDPNQVMKLLLLLEFLMTSDLVNLERLTKVCKDVLVHVYNSQTGPPQSKARKLIRILEKLTCCDTFLTLNNPKDVLVEV